VVPLLLSLPYSPWFWLLLLVSDPHRGQECSSQSLPRLAYSAPSFLSFRSFRSFVFSSFLSVFAKVPRILSQLRRRNTRVRPLKRCVFNDFGKSRRGFGACSGLSAGGRKEVRNVSFYTFLRIILMFGEEKRRSSRPLWAGERRRLDGHFSERLTLR